MVKLVTFGETLVRYSEPISSPLGDDGGCVLELAGAESNVAVNVDRLGVPDLETVWVSRLGDDAGGRFILNELAGRTQVVAELCKGQTTGAYNVDYVADGTHVKTYFRKASAASFLTFAEIKPHLEGADVVHVTGITPALSDSCCDTVFEALHWAGNRGIPVSFDVNYRPQLWKPADARLVYEAIIDQSTIAKVGYDEAKTVWGYDWSPRKYAEHLNGHTDRVVIVTLDAGGAIVFDGDSVVEVGGYSVDVVDSVGAGDAFVAGFLAGVLLECHVKELIRMEAGRRRSVLEGSLRIANVCGALLCTQRGDTAAMPTMKEVREFIRGYD